MPRLKLLETHLLRQKNLDKALLGPTDVRIAAAMNPNLTSDQLHKALSDKSEFVRKHALENPGITQDHITKALSDPKHIVRSSAIYISKDRGWGGK